TARAGWNAVRCRLQHQERRRSSTRRSWTWIAHRGRAGRRSDRPLRSREEADSRSRGRARARIRRQAQGRGGEVSLQAIKAKLAATAAIRPVGRVVAVTGLSLKFSMPGVRVGDVVMIKRRGDPLACEVVGFDGGEAIGMPLGALTGVGPDDEVESTGGG